MKSSLRSTPIRSRFMSLAWAGLLAFGPLLPQLRGQTDNFDDNNDDPVGTLSTDATYDNYFAAVSEPPRIEISYNAGFNEVLVSWLTNVGPFLLQSATNLSVSPIIWTEISDARIFRSGGRFTYTEEPLELLKIFRLNQDSYSANAVGYVNLSLKAGLNLIANPFNGTNKHLNTILPLPNSAADTTLFRFKPAIQNYGDSITFVANFGWFTTEADPNFYILNPGEGVFVRPSGPTPLNVTFVGELPQGALSNPVGGNNRYSILASQVPQALPLGSAGQAGTLRFPALDGDTVFIFDAMTQTYKDSYTYFATFGWFSTNPDDPGPNGPVIPVGTSFFVQKKGADTGQVWTRNFSVN